MSFGRALYYPYINLTNKNLLKHALLFWDKISKIVPHSVDPCDSEDIVRIRCETCFVDDCSPENNVIVRTFNDFEEFFIGSFFQMIQFGIFVSIYLAG